MLIWFWRIVFWNEQLFKSTTSPPLKIFTSTSSYRASLCWWKRSILYAVRQCLKILHWSYMNVSDITILSGNVNAKIGSNNKDSSYIKEKMMENHRIDKLSISWIFLDRKIRNLIKYIAIGRNCMDVLWIRKNEKVVHVYSVNHLPDGKIKLAA